MEHDRRAKPRAEIRRTARQIAELLVEGEVELRLKDVVNARRPVVRRLEVESRRHRLDAQMVLPVDQNAHGAVVADIGAAMGRILEQLAADEMLLPKHVLLKRRALREFDAVERLFERLLHVAEHGGNASFRLSEPDEIRAVGEGSFVQISREADAARQDDVAVRAIRCEPCEMRACEEFLLRHHASPPSTSFLSSAEEGAEASSCAFSLSCAAS